MSVNCPGKTAESLCTPDYSLGTWFHLGISWDGTEAVMYVDGVEKHRVPLASLGSSTFPLTMGGRVFESTGGNLDGILDEVRISTTPRSVEWFALSIANQSNPNGFFTVGSEQSEP